MNYVNHDKAKFKSGIFKSFNKCISVIDIHIYREKCLNIYQVNNIKRIKKARERYQNLSKEEKESNNTVVNVTKISQKIKKINWLSIEKNIME